MQSCWAPGPPDRGKKVRGALGRQGHVHLGASEDLQEPEVQAGVLLELLGAAVSADFQVAPHRQDDLGLRPDEHGPADLELRHAAGIVPADASDLGLTLELTRFRGHLILCVQEVANVQNLTTVPGGISPADARSVSSRLLTRAALV